MKSYLQSYTRHVGVSPNIVQEVNLARCSLPSDQTCAVLMGQQVPGAVMFAQLRGRHLAVARQRCATAVGTKLDGIVISLGYLLLGDAASALRCHEAAGI